MAIELYFRKSDSSIPWGFRLTGGSDCDLPVTVIQVTEESIADNAGLQVDDVIVRINNQPTVGLTHAEVHEVFLAAGLEFLIAVRRGDMIDYGHDEEQSNEEVCNIMEGSIQRNLSTIPELKQEENGPTQSNPKPEITDDQIAEAISGEAELLPDQNVLGVNFNKVDLTESTVLKALEEETIETNLDIHNKKWSTFLQKPNTPKVIPKKKEAEGPKAPPYRVIITKQPKKIDQKIEVSAAPVCEKVDESDIQETEEAIDKDRDEKSVESENSERDWEEQHEEELNEETLEDKEIAAELVSNCSEEEMVACSENKLTETVPVTVESVLSLEEQLAQVQQQLQALAQLPSAIQVSLDAVTQQLVKIVRATHKGGDEETTAEQSVISEDETIEHATEEETLECMTTLEETVGAMEGEEETNLEKTDLTDISEDEAEAEEQLNKEIETGLNLSENVSEIDSQEHLLDTEKAMQQERKIMQMEEFHQRRLEQRPTHPLTPLQRPIILPGGRRWSQPNDALPVPKKPKMTDEKISATIETYSEVIAGRTKGINFLKYQPPPKNLDYLQHSEVFKLVHDMDPPRRGIAARPGKIISEQDYYTEKPFQDQQTPVVV